MNGLQGMFTNLKLKKLGMSPELYQNNLRTAMQMDAAEGITDDPEQGLYYLTAKERPDEFSAYLAEQDMLRYAQRMDADSGTNSFTQAFYADPQRFAQVFFDENGNPVYGNPRTPAS